MKTVSFIELIVRPIIITYCDCWCYFFNNWTKVFSLIVYTNYVIHVYFIAKMTCLDTKE